MHRREVVGGLVGLSGQALLPRAAQAQFVPYTNWRHPNTKPFLRGNNEALRLLKPALDDYPGVHEQLVHFVLNTDPVVEYLQEVPDGIDGTHFVMMTYDVQMVLRNLIVTNDDLTSDGWANRTREMWVWRMNGLNPRGQIIIVEYYWHRVCNNRSIAVKTSQGLCLVIPNICDPGCEELRRQVSRR